MRLLITALSIGFLAATIARAQTFNVLHDFGSGQDGKEPTAAVLYSKGRLYGTTQIGGATSNGTIYSLNPKGDKEKVVHSFMLSVDGSNPSSTLIEIAGVFYGTTSAGGPNSGDGTVFAFNPGTDAVTT